MISPVYSSVNQFPQAIQNAIEMKQISTTMSEINDSHEHRKEETDEINREVYNG